jgi:hypothetical protein
MKILLGGVSTKVGREGIFKPTIGNKDLHEINKDNGVRVVNDEVFSGCQLGQLVELNSVTGKATNLTRVGSFSTSRNLIVKSTVFPHCSI